MLERIAILTLSGVALGLAVSPASADTLPATLAKALEGAELDTREGWAYRQTVQVDAMDDPAVTTVIRWDPSKPPAERCTVVLVEIEGVSKGKAHDEDPCDDAEDRELYGDLVQLVQDSIVETVSENEQAAVYRIIPRDKQKGFRMGGMHVDVGDEELENFEGTLVVTKTADGAPYVQRLELGIKEPKGNLLARLGKLDIVFTYAPDPATGAKLLSSLSVDIQLRLFTLFNITTQVSQRYDEYRRVQ